MTNDLGPVSPLMQPIYLRNIEYRTTHFLHQFYRNNSPHGGKYQRHDHFIRVLKNIKHFQGYVEHGDVLILSSYKELINASPELGEVKENKTLQDAFRAVSYRTLYLVSATIQIALSNHLDDEISKQTAVTANTAMARQLSQKSDLLPEEIADRVYAAMASIARQMNVSEHVAQQEAIKQIAARYGVDLRAYLLAAPAQQSIKDDEKMLEPNDLAKALGLASGMLLNQHLHAVGWQIPKIGGGWEATPTGKAYCTTHAWVAGNKSGYNYKFNVEAVRDVLKARGLLPEPPPQQEQLPI